MRYALRDEDQVVFLHTPKTAGTTLINILQHRFSPDETCPAALLPELARLSPEELGSYRFFRGHFYYHMMRQILPREPVFLILLRHPVELALSLYDQLQRLQGALPEERLFGVGMELEDFVHDTRASFQIKNLQTRVLCARPAFRELGEVYRARIADSERILAGGPDVKADEAKDVLARGMTFVGLTERFQASLDLLSFTLSWRPVREYPRLNVSASRPRSEGVPDHVMERILELNQEDLALYDHATSLFEERFSNMLHTLIEESYESFNPRFDGCLASVSYDFEPPVPGLGWQVPERGPAGRWLCWTGPGTESTLDFPVATGGDLRVQLCVVHALAEEILASLALRVNDHPIPIIPRRTDDGWIFEGRVPATVLDCNRRFTRLTLEVTRTISPRELDPHSADARHLGVAVGWVRVAPATGG